MHLNIHECMIEICQNHNVGGPPAAQAEIPETYPHKIYTHPHPPPQKKKKDKPMIATTTSSVIILKLL